jgi:hypothetical protein
MVHQNGIETTVLLSIYNDKGSSVYNRENQFLAVRLIKALLTFEAIPLYQNNFCTTPILECSYTWNMLHLLPVLFFFEWAGCLWTDWTISLLYSFDLAGLHTLVFQKPAGLAKLPGAIVWHLRNHRSLSDRCHNRHGIHIFFYIRTIDRPRSARSY